MDKEVLSYKAVAKSLEVPLHLTFPAELHGYLCGILCGKSDATETAQFKLLTEWLHDELSIDALSGAVLELVSQTRTQLQSTDFEFQLLLPDDDESLQTRLHALVKWCQSFLEALGVAGLAQENIDQAKLSEILNDLTEITRVSYKQLDDSSEEDYMQLVEYVRSVVMLLYMEGRSSDKGTRKGNQSIH